MPVNSTTYRFSCLGQAIAYMDGWWDCLKSKGEIPEEAAYVPVWIDLDNGDARIVLIDKEAKKDYPQIPVVVIELNHDN